MASESLDLSNWERFSSVAVLLLEGIVGIAFMDEIAQRSLLRERSKDDDSRTIGNGINI